MKKKKFSTELAYFLSLIIIAIEVSIMEKCNFGVSMVVAPAYLLYRKLSLIFPFVTFGMAEYTFQAILLAAMCLVMRKFRISWLFSFATAVLYGFILDGCMYLCSFIVLDTLPLRIIFFVIAMLLGACGISLMFHAYISPEVYELFVKEVSHHTHTEIHKFKTGYDIASCLVGLLMSIVFFGFWPLIGVNIGTVVCALVNGWLISLFSKFYEAKFEFVDSLPWRPFFTGEQPIRAIK